MSTVLSTLADATPSWLTTVLRSNGTLASGDVRSISVTHVHDEQLDSISYFLAVAYSAEAPASAPTRLFLKLPRRSAAAGAYPAASREIQMYQVIGADQQQLPIVPCYDAAYDQQRGSYHLLLADLSHSHDQPRSHLAIADAYIVRTVDSLARLHAYWQAHPRLGNGIGKLATSAQIDEQITHLRRVFPAYAAALKGRLNPIDCMAYEQLLRVLPTLWASRTTLAGQTLVHGDAHFWNFLYPRARGQVDTYIIDWQAYHIAPGMADLAYTLVLRYPHRTTANEHYLVKRYHQQLVQHGVLDYDWTRCWLDYRRLAAEQLLFPLQMWSSAMPGAFWSLFLDRALTGFRDLNCAALPELQP